MRKLTNKKFRKEIQKFTIIKVDDGDEKLIDDLCIDSLSIISFIANIEKKYAIEIPDKLLSVDRTITVNELYKIITEESDCDVV